MCTPRRAFGTVYTDSGPEKEKALAQTDRHAYVCNSHQNYKRDAQRWGQTAQCIRQYQSKPCSHSRSTIASYMDLRPVNYCTCTYVYPSSHWGSGLTLSNEIKLSSSWNRWMLTKLNTLRRCREAGGPSHDHLLLGLFGLNWHSAMQYNTLGTAFRRIGKQGQTPQTIALRII